jgi:predicted permease
VGDLLEDYAARRAAIGRWRAEWWLVGEMSSLRRAYRRQAGRSAVRGRRAWHVRPSDLTQAWRSLRRAPAYAITLAAVVAVSLALATTVFAVVDGVLFKPLPYRHADRLFAVTLGQHDRPESFRPFAPISAAEFLAWSSAAPDGVLTAFSVGDRQPVGVHDFVPGARIDAAFFDVIGMRPVIGGFAPEDFLATGPIAPALVTWRFWRDRLGADPGAIGRSLVDDHGQGIRVVGVLPRNFLFPFPARTAELLMPRVDATPRGLGRTLRVLERLDPSIPVEAASARLAAVVAAWANTQSSSSTGATRPAPDDAAGLQPIRQALTEGWTEKPWIAFATALALLLIACLNFSSLAVARISRQWRDLAVRRALGATYVDLLRLLTVEHAAIVMVGAAAGGLGAYLLLAIMRNLIDGMYMTVLKPPTIDLRVIAFLALASIVCVVAVTAVAARAATRASLRSAIADGGHATSRGRRWFSVVAFEVAAALVMTVTGALVVGSLLRVWGEDPGLDVDRTAVVSIAPPAGASVADLDALVSVAGHLPGVAAAGGTAHSVLEHAFNGSVFDTPPGVAGWSRGEGFPIESIPVTHGYLQAAGLRPSAGRLPTDEEFRTGAPVIVVSQGVARRYWQGRRPIGQILTYNDRPFTVVGVVADAKYLALDLDEVGEIYWPVAASPRPAVSNLLVRFGTSRNAVTPFVANLRRACPQCWVGRAEMLTDALGDSIRPRRFSAWLFSAFGAAALTITGVGILGLVAMTTSRRTREIGIRMALGAHATIVTWQIVREQLRSIALGLAIGGLVAAYVVRFVAAYLYKTPVYDPWAWGAAIAVLLAVATIGALVPARRAGRVNPMQALNAE